MMDRAFTRAQKALRVANLILALGLFCLGGEIVLSNLHAIIHEVIHFSSVTVCEQNHIHAGFECEKDLAVFSSAGGPSIDIVHERAVESRLITYAVYLPNTFPPPKII